MSWKDILKAPLNPRELAEAEEFASEDIKEAKKYQRLEKVFTIIKDNPDITAWGIANVLHRKHMNMNAKSHSWANQALYRDINALLKSNSISQQEGRKLRNVDRKIMHYTAIVDKIDDRTRKIYDNTQEAYNWADEDPWDMIGP